MKVLRELLGSKKFVASLAATIAAGIARFGFDVPTETVMAILSPLIAYVVGQGVADHGKEAVKAQKAVQA